MIRNALIWVLWRAGVVEIYRRILVRQKRFVIMFHGISSRKWHDIPPGAQPYLSVHDLANILSWIRSRYNFLTPDEFLNTAKSGLLLTFDDGLANNYTNALPVLARFGAPAVFFITTQHVVDPKNWLPTTRRTARGGWGDESAVPDYFATDFFDGLSPTQVGECAAHSLITIGAHTVSHPYLTRCDGEQMMAELMESKTYLENITSDRVDLFAYPSGDYNADVVRAVKSIGYRAAFAVSTLKIGNPLFEIPRVGLYESNEPYLSFKLSGLHRPALGVLTNN